MASAPEGAEAVFGVDEVAGAGVGVGVDVGAGFGFAGVGFRGCALLFVLFSSIKLLFY